jgi:hypothetical protein
MMPGRPSGADATGVADPDHEGTEEWDQGEPIEQHAASGRSEPLRLERVGGSYKVAHLGADFTFRDVRVDRELSADVTVAYRGRHLFRSGITLGLTGRDKMAKIAAELSQTDSGTPWKRITFAVSEAVIAAEESLGGLVDLRLASGAAAGLVDILRPLQPNAPGVLTMPGEGGKSTIARACAVSVATGLEIIPGLVPFVSGPVLIVAAEDSAVASHARSLEAICRGAGIDRASMKNPVHLLDARGRPLHRIARSLSERAADCPLVILDSLQALLPTAEAYGGVRDRDGLFWNGVDSIERPCLVLAHPNRNDSQRWASADGRIAGSEVHRDRTRIAWRGTWTDEKAVAGSSYRRYTLTCVKRNNGPRPSPISFAAAWEFGLDDDPGVLRFFESEPVGNRTEESDRPLTKSEEETVAAYRDGNRTPAKLASVLGINPNAAKARLQRAKAQGLLLHLVEDPS